MGAWIETKTAGDILRNVFVAPLVGAWIETMQLIILLNLHVSHPSWVRGLKLSFTRFLLISGLSHPSWVRGLKLGDWTRYVQRVEVAPLVGAWIETSGKVNLVSINYVAPLVGAWIETGKRLKKLKRLVSRTPRGCVD